jgi:hypothetical protein
MKTPEDLKEWLRNNKPISLEQVQEKFPKIKPELIDYHFSQIQPGYYKTLMDAKQAEAATSEEAFALVKDYTYKNQDADLDQVRKAFPLIDDRVIANVYQNLAENRGKRQKGKSIKQMIVDDPDIDFKTVLKHYPETKRGTFASLKSRTLKQLEKEGKLKNQTEEAEVVLEDDTTDLLDDDAGLMNQLDEAADLDDEELLQDDDKNEDEDFEIVTEPSQPKATTAKKTVRKKTEKTKTVAQGADKIDKLIALLQALKSSGSLPDMEITISDGSINIKNIIL